MWTRDKRGRRDRDGGNSERKAVRAKYIQGKQRREGEKEKHLLAVPFFSESLVLAFSVCPVCHCLYKQ